jgi:hypothetical protein
MQSVQNVATGTTGGMIQTCPCTLKSRSRIAQPTCRNCKGWGRFQLCSACCGAGIQAGASTACARCEGKGRHPGPKVLA